MANLVNIGVPLRIGQYIKRSVQIIKHPDNLHSTLVIIIPGAVVSKTNNATEEKSHCVVTTSRDGATVAELSGNADWQYGIQEPGIQLDLLVIDGFSPEIGRRKSQLKVTQGD